jgi:hypothetical protein
LFCVGSPFGLTYGTVTFDGRWLLNIDQSVVPLKKDPSGRSGSFGTISDWVLVITDLAGIVHAYHQDLRAVVKTLPRYGTLYTSPKSTPNPYGDWREAFDVAIGYVYNISYNSIDYPVI